MNIISTAPPYVTKDSIKKDLEILPPGVDISNKYYLGFYENNNIIAVMDLIIGYPNQHTLFIGLLMLDVNYQNKGIGKLLIDDLTNFAIDNSFNALRLAWVKENKKAEKFWLKNGFYPLNEKKSLNDTALTVIEATKLI